MIDIETRPLARTYPYLYDAVGGSLHATLLSHGTNGVIAAGDIVQTASYYPAATYSDSKNHGGATYRVVAAATGTDDGGSYIDVGSVQLELIAEEVAIDQFGAVGDDSTNDASPIQAAVDAGFPRVRIGARTYRTFSQITVPSNIEIFGYGFASVLKCPTFSVTIIDIAGKTDVILRDFALTHGASISADYDQDGRGIYGGSGNGSSESSQRVTISNVYAYNISSQAIANFAGGKNWIISACRFDNCGRAGIVFNGMRFGSITGCIFGETGDDGIGLVANSYANSVVGNTFDSSGAFEDAAAAGVAIQGQANVVSGNAFSGVHSAVRLDGNVALSWGDDHLYGASQANLISNNVVWSLHDVDSAPTDPVGFRLHNTSHANLTGNTVYGISSDGSPRECLRLENAHNIRSSGNTYIGHPPVTLFGDYSSGVVFYRDTFYSLDDGTNWYDRHAIATNYGASVVDTELVVEDCFIDPEMGAIVRCDFTDTIKQLVVRGCQLAEPFRIAWPDGDVSGATTSITLRSDHELFGGMFFDIADTATLYLADKDSKESFTLDEAADKGDTTLTTVSFTPASTYSDTKSWIEIKRKATGDTAIVYAPAGANVTVKYGFNDLPGFDPYVSFGTVTDTYEMDQAAHVGDATTGSAAEINAIRDSLVSAGLMASS